MEEQVRKLNAEYGLNLTEDEIKTVAKQSQELDRVLKPLMDMDLSEVAPIQRIDKRVQK